MITLRISSRTTPQGLQRDDLKARLIYQSMARSTEEKIAELQNLYPDYGVDGLLDVLVSCGGSLKRSAQLLGDTTTPESSSKRFKSRQQQTLNRFLDVRLLPKAAIKTNGSKASRPIELHSKEDVESTLKYCTYHPNVLPLELANKLLEALSKDTSFKPNEFYLFGNKCISNCKSRIFLPENRIEPFYYNGKRVESYSTYSDEIMMAQILVEELVNDVLSQRTALPFQVEAGKWEVQAVLSNSYSRDSNLDWHSDRLTNIGPHAIIASLSLGFTREFRVRRVHPSNSSTYSLRPQHNSLIIMHAGFQEEYKHCVPFLPKNCNIPAEDVHPISNDVRVNLTFRNYALTTKVFCKLCGFPMDLRRSFKDPSKRGLYIFQCSKSYTEENSFKEGRECKGFAFACFKKKPPFTEFETDGSRWIADDDLEAKQAQRQLK
ncbi:KLTH0F00594p [Lachancea thermotolerans CBS 6340]|uniref:KLTH0F00594p n=1 Tax=Lachancea thermotolerans (strain ATCC 56472 / CBS 6340 / NRRL Y-8284) TaxID=559295 RepID=C5DJZ6_LACTC|nr:KLTH0F00594p [Lachancea thermotolerans CBS 6340]CAR23797.1 KLTH0F00594p [Lachancea thermotolerans CBS 6340]